MKALTAATTTTAAAGRNTPMNSAEHMQYSLTGSKWLITLLQYTTTKAARTGASTDQRLLMRDTDNLQQLLI
jgi:hypothetical protein